MNNDPLALLLKSFRLGTMAETTLPHYPRESKKRKETRQLYTCPSKCAVSEAGHSLIPGTSELIVKFLSISTLHMCF